MNWGSNFIINDGVSQIIDFNISLVAKFTGSDDLSQAEDRHSHFRFKLPLPIRCSRKTDFWELIAMLKN